MTDISLSQEEYGSLNQRVREAENYVRFLHRKLTAPLIVPEYLLEAHERIIHPKAANPTNTENLEIKNA